MKRKLQVIPSGIPLVDLTWGGFYRGGTYFLLGPRKSGRTILALQFAQQAVIKKESCLYFCSFRPKDLLINAAAIDIDLQENINRNMFTLVRVTPAKNIEYAKDPDSYMKEYIKDLKTVVDQYNPDRVVFDELTQFIGFKDINFLTETFLETIDYIEDKGITSLFVISEPATSAANKIASALLNVSTGYILLEKNEAFVNKSNPGTIKIIPNVGHVEGEFSSRYFIEPSKGIQTDFKPVLNNSVSKSEEENGLSYLRLEKPSVNQKNTAATSFYTLDDFKLLLNNQIAFFNLTNQVSTLVSVRLDVNAEKENLLTVIQLANAVRLSIEKKDKICILKNGVLILFPKEEKDINSLGSTIVNNLPDDSTAYLKKITAYISLNSVRTEKGTNSADKMFEELRTAYIPGKEKTF